jgi:eukaryotic-like serine/threonine-protein kinase
MLRSAMTAPRLPPGQRFGAYLVEACVGEGGMGAVYRATDTKLGRRVALKVIRPDAESGPSADAIARFLREARVGAALAHPNIVVVFEAGAIGDTPYLAMEWVDGASLAALVDHGPSALTLAHRLDILEAVSDALAHAHSRGVIHRDVKPTNVMIDERGRARLVDFGIAKRTTALALGTQMLPTHARAMLGTPAYMAPEQMLSPAVDARADQFSWGVMAYELLGDAHPNETVQPDGPPFPVAKPQPLAWLRPEVPEALAAVVHRAMSYEPGARFGSMDELSYAWRAARWSGAAGASTPPPHVPPYGPPTSPGYGATPHGRHNDVSTVAHTRATAAAHTPAVRPLSHAPHAVPPARGFPWPVLFAACGLLVVVAGAGLALVLTGHVPASLPGSASSPLTSPVPVTLGGPRTAFVEPLDTLKFTGTPAEVARAKSAVETKLATCLGAVSKDLSFSLEILVVPDGRITKVQEMNVCKEQHPSFYLCTERERAADPKKGFPTVPEAVFACVERAFISSRLPRITVDPGEATDKQDVHVQVR